VAEYIASGTLKAQRPTTASQRICVFESIEALPE
jgi:hypothetical protein